jgi:hypothetical protein
MLAIYRTLPRSATPQMININGRTMALRPARAHSELARVGGCARVACSARVLVRGLSPDATAGGDVEPLFETDDW